MLKRLKYDVTFPSTGKRFAGEWDFEEGLTAISGANEAGKTLIQEFIRYGLWGTKALRGNATDYRTLKLELEFIVNDVWYQVRRQGSASTLHRGSVKEMIATGAAPVNAKIIEIFGYDMTVFDVANNISQGEVEALGKMTSGERKKMVDQTIGLNVLDELADWLAATATTEKKVYDALSEALVEPVAPTEPHEFETSAVLVAAQAELSARVTDFHQITGWLQARASLSRPDPVRCDIIETAADLRAIEKRRQDNLVAINSRRDQLTRLPTLTHTPGDIAAAREKLAAVAAYREKGALAMKWPRPNFAEQALVIHEKLNEVRRLQTERDRLLEHMQVCPHCEREFAQDHGRVAEIDAELDLIPVRIGNESWDRILSDKEIAKQRAYNEAYAEVGPIDYSPIAPEPATVQEPEIRRWEAEIEADKIRVKLLLEIKQLEAQDVPDRSADLQARVEYEAAKQQYDFRMKEWEKFVAEKDAKLARLAEVTGSDAALSHINAKLVESRAYEAASVIFERAHALWATNAAKADAAKQKAEKLDKARRAIKALKVAIKGHLVPSLNQVASHLISQMTATERNTIEVDENFEIMVDGQPIGTLSGSAKAVANLSLRVALGQVLTNKVFSVLMGDEIDASMDANRAGYTAECMERLTKSIGQVLLVSHKSIDAQHHIEVS